MTSFNSVESYKKQFDLAEQYRTAPDYKHFVYDLGFKYDCKNWNWTAWDEQLIKRVEKIENYHFFKLVLFYRKQKIIFKAKDLNKLQIFEVLYDLFGEELFQVTFNKNNRITICFDPDGVSYKSSTRF